MRSRLLGFDTQEVPRDPGRTDCRVPQPLWREGRQFLQEELCGLRGDIHRRESSVTVIVLTSITGFYWTSMASLMRKRCQRKLNVFLHYQGLRWPKGHCAQDMLSHQITILSGTISWHEFQEASRQRKGGFSGEQFVHLSVCRREGYRMEVSTSVRRRHRYAE